MEIDIDAEQLIALVETHPVIWDKSRDGHRERVTTRDAWIIICAQLRDDFHSLPVPEKKAFLTAVVKRWRNIRDQWLKWKNKHQNPLKYNPTCRAYRRKYIYHNQLRFLESVPANNHDHTEMSQEEFLDHFNLNDSEIDQDQPELLLRIKSSASSESLKSCEPEQDADEPEMGQDFFAGADFSPVPGDSLSKNRKASSEPEDPSEDDRHIMFFRSVIPYLRSFSERKILDFQMAVLQLVKTSMETDPFSNNQ